MPRTRAPADTSIDNNEVYVAAVMVPYVHMADAHLGGTVTVVLECVAQTAPAGALSVVTAVYISSVSLTTNAAMIEDSIASIAFLWYGGFFGQDAHKWLIIVDSLILN